MKHLILIAILAGCASPGKRLNNISLGMSKREVIHIMGTPNSVKAADNVEVLVYAVDRFWSAEAFTYVGEYWIELENDEVIRYGKPGDFGNAAPPTQKIIIERSGAGY